VPEAGQFQFPPQVPSIVWFAASARLGEEGGHPSYSLQPPGPFAREEAVTAGEGKKGRRKCLLGQGTFTIQPRPSLPVVSLHAACWAHSPSTPLPCWTFHLEHPLPSCYLQNSPPPSNSQARPSHPRSYRCSAQVTRKPGHKTKGTAASKPQGWPSEASPKQSKPGCKSCTFLALSGDYVHGTATLVPKVFTEPVGHKLSLRYHLGLESRNCLVLLQNVLL
jgi:hypothetical protein